jgi:hypothetical protein
MLHKNQRRGLVRWGHTETGLLLSSPVGFSGPEPVPNAKISRVKWIDESLIAEWIDDSAPIKSRALRRQMSPAEAESQFLHGIPTPSLMTLSVPEVQGLLPQR